MRASKNIISIEGRRGIKAWITEEILDLMEERRVLKYKSEEIYKELDRRMKQRCKERKEQCLRERCEEIEKLEKSDSRLMAVKIRELTGKRGATRSSIIKDKYGNILTERVEAIKRWEEYVKELKGDTRDKNPDFGNVYFEM